MRVGDLSGLPAEAIEHFEAEGIDELYPPQAEAVEAGVTDGRSVVASVPTASGKTFVAELAMLSAIRQGGKALYIVPLRALASEKAEQFRAYEAFGISVGISTGNYESDESWLGSRDVIVATSEKVDSLVRNGAGWLAELTCVVADEVHLVDDRNRGPTLEVTLAKIRAINPDVQVVALSATVGNADVVAEWLDAELVDSTWRPIDLKTGVHYGNAINFDDGTQREVPVGKREKQETALVRDIVAEGGSSLVFVNSRRNAESAARRLAGTVSEFLTDEERESLADVAEEIREVSDTGTSTDLANAVEQGAAFHHAGLARGHRSLVEDAFRDRLVKVVSATPTLAAGVNTPSRRVVVRDWRRYDGSYGGMKPLDALEVHQMFGRAGRPGLDDYGEAVLLASDHETAGELFDRYVYADPEPVRSKLAAEPALRTHVLSTVASGFARSREELLDFLDRTLYATQTTEADRLPTVVDTVVEYLSRNEFLERDGETLTATRTGHLVSRLYLDPMSAAELIYGLEDAQEVLDSHAVVVDDEDADADTAAEAAADELGLDTYPTALGLFHLVSRTPDMYELYLRSGDRETYTELAYEHEREFLGDMPTEFEDVAWEDWLSSLKTAKLLDDWAGEEDEERITTRYGVGPGDIRGKVETAQWLLNAAERLAAELDLDSVHAVRRARKRVEHGVREDLLDLVGVRGVGRKRARRLFRAGIETRADLRAADKGVVLAALNGRRKTAQNILENVGHRDPEMDGVVARDPASGSGSGAAGAPAGGSSAGAGGAGDGPAAGTAADEADEGDDQASLGDF